MERTSYRLAARTLSCCIGILALFFSPALFAGFDYPSSTAAQYDGEPVGRDGACPSSTIEKLANKFSISEDEAKEKLNAMRNNIKEAIAAVTAQNATIGQCLTDALNCERVCIDFQNTRANASAQTDGETGCRGDKINIGCNTIPCDSVTAASPDLLQLILSLLHEGTHATQDFNSGTDDPDDCRKKVKKAKKVDCNEIEAENNENEVIDALLPALQEIKDGGSPTPPAGAAGVIIGGLNGISDDAARIQAACDMQDKANRIKAGNDQHIACREQRKEAMDEFLNGTKTKAEMNACLRMTRWYQRFGNRGTYGIVNDPVITGGGGTSTIRQYDGVDDYILFTGLEYTTDLLLTGDFSAAIVAGINVDGVGELIAFFDTDEDGIYEQSSMETLLTFDEWTVGLDISYQEETGTYYVLDGGNQLVWSVTDANDDGLPDEVSSVPVTDGVEEMELVSHLATTNDPTTMYGYIDQEANTQILVKASSFVVIRDVNEDGFFETIYFEDIFQQTVSVAAFVIDPVDGDNSVIIDASYLAEIDLLRVDEEGNELELLASGQADELGQLDLAFVAPLQDGWYLSLRDNTNENATLPYLVSAGSVSSVSAEIARAFRLRVSPVPATDRLTVSFNLEQPLDVRLSIVNMHGVEVTHLPERSLANGEHSMHVNTGLLPAGTYFCKLEAGGHVVTRRIIISR